MPTATRRSKKGTRLNLRASADQKRRIRTAADRLGVSASSFVLDSATAKAEEVLADSTEFVLPEAQWKLFVEALERPVRIKSRLRKLLTEPSVLERRS